LRIGSLQGRQLPREQRGNDLPAGGSAMTDLSGKTVLVTGASKGIGAAIAASLGQAGASVIAAYNSDHEGVRQATAGIPEDRRQLLSLDLSQPGAGRELWQQAARLNEPIDVLVCNAAVMLDSPLNSSDAEWDEAWRQTLAVNVLEPANLMRAATREFVSRGGGILIVLSSWSAQRGSGNPDLLAYAASKAAVKSLAQTLARTHAKDGVLVYIIAPGIVRTRMSEISAARLGGEEAVTATLAMGEWVPPQEIGELVTLLASGTMRHLSGATLDINGASYIR
jgi:NAD(P)-dependent dehydrogenase (short-subunit alcohol dehydrogenase family)